MQGTSNLYYGSVKSSLSDALNGPDGEQLQRTSICLMLFSQAAVHSACRLLVTDIMGQQSAIIRAAVPNVSGCVLSQTARCTRRARLQACTHVVVLSWRRFKEKSRKITCSLNTTNSSTECNVSLFKPDRTSSAKLKYYLGDSKKEASLSFSPDLQSQKVSEPMGTCVLCLYVCKWCQNEFMSAKIVPRKSQNLWDESPLVIV